MLRADRGESSASRKRAATVLSAAALFAINAFICRTLFTAAFTERMESIESSYIAISRWAMDHWHDLTWFPLWFTGMPFHQVYQPGLHLTVAALASAVHGTPQHAYHFVTALAYCAAPVTLFWLCYTATGRRAYGLVAGLLFSLVSPMCFLAPTIRYDVGAWYLPRRFQTLVHYGEGPHIAALALIPLAIWLLDRAACAQRAWYVPAAALAVAAVALTNWPGTIGLGFACLAYCISGRPIRWPRLAAVGAIGYLIAAPWMPPSILILVFRNAHQSDATALGRSQLAVFAGVAVSLVLLHVVFRRMKTDPWFRFFTYFAVIAGAVTLGREWFGWRLLPQPNRFQLELEMAIAGAVAYAAVFWFGRVRRPVVVAAVCVGIVFAFVQVRRYSRYAVRYTQPIDITSTIEYRMARWFEANMGGRRVFAPGNVSLWMNVFTDTPQLAGCCDQGIPDQEYRIATYTIYTGQNAGARDAEISLLWLRAYGADAVGVTGPASTEYFKPFWNPRKFDRVLPVLWRSGDNAVYRVPRASASLAHVVPEEALVSRPPENGLDVDPLRPFVAALENPGAPPASFRWVSGHEAEVEARLGPGDVIALQVTYDKGWRATENGLELPIARDALGMMSIDPGHDGPCRIRLVWDGGFERRAARGMAILGWVLLLAWPGAVYLRSRRSPAAPTAP